MRRWVCLAKQRLNPSKRLRRERPNSKLRGYKNATSTDHLRQQMTNTSSSDTLAAHRLQAIRNRLSEALKPLELTVEDQSHLHRGHAGAQSGRGHFAVQIVSPMFNGMSLIQRHRAVYAALGELMTSDIHALSITALAPDE